MLNAESFHYERKQNNPDTKIYNRTDYKVTFCAFFWCFDQTSRL